MVKKGEPIVVKGKEEPKTKRCFFVTPIGENGSVENKKMKALVANILEPLCEKNNYNLKVSSTIDNIGSITDQIVKELVESDLVIVDLTNLNANVMYELAVRHSFGKPCISICDNDTKLPFDIAAERTIFFDDTIEGSGYLQEELQKKLKNIEEEDTDNPITRAVTRSAILEKAVEQKGDSTGLIISMLNEIQTSLTRSNNIDKTIRHSGYYDNDVSDMLTRRVNVVHNNKKATIEVRGMFDRITQLSDEDIDGEITRVMNIAKSNSINTDITLRDVQDLFRLNTDIRITLPNIQELFKMFDVKGD